MLKGLEGDCQEKEEKKADQVEGSACAKARGVKQMLLFQARLGVQLAGARVLGGPWRVFWETILNYKWLDILG